MFDQGGRYFKQKSFCPIAIWQAYGPNWGGQLRKIVFAVYLQYCGYHVLTLVESINYAINLLPTKCDLVINRLKSNDLYYRE